jgi:hypothetical protein
MPIGLCLYLHLLWLLWLQVFHLHGRHFKHLLVHLEPALKV